MIFLGDIAHPFSKAPLWRFDSFIPDFNKPVVANLEGSLVQMAGFLLEQRKLFNHYSVSDAFVENNVGAVCLANNHVTDVSPSSLENTVKWLKETGVETFGAGKNSEDAGRPAMLNAEGREWMLLGFGWETIQCRAAGPDKPGVNPLRPQHVLESTAYWRKKKPDGVLVIMMHWNYEMELYPQPAHRQLAMAAIDAGADAVIGHHPHRGGGVEMYKNRPIAYSLGNWWMPQGVYFDGNLTFGDETLLELALEWQPGSEPICHWFEYSRANHHLSFIDSELWSKSERLSALTPFTDMAHNDYEKWFSQNRIKRKALPVYKDFRNTMANVYKDKYVQLRHSGIMFLEKSGLRSIFK